MRDGVSHGDVYSAPAGWMNSDLIRILHEQDFLVTFEKGGDSFLSTGEFSLVYSSATKAPRHKVFMIC